MIEATMTKPLLIGVSARIHYPDSPTAPGSTWHGVYTKTLHFAEQSVVQWVLSGGALALMIPAITKYELPHRSDIDIQHYAEALDGLVLQGGNDVAPEQYGEDPMHPDWGGDAVRDRYEMALVRAFADAGKPVFGICRGLQLINVTYGGSLFQDLHHQQATTLPHRELARYEHFHHAVEFVPGTELAALYKGQPRATTNSIHHQGIKALAPGFVVEARCPDDGTVEAIRSTDPKRWIAGVQWHPEFHPPGDPVTLDDTPILLDFLAAARAARG